MPDLSPTMHSVLAAVYQREVDASGIWAGMGTVRGTLRALRRRDLVEYTEGERPRVTVRGFRMLPAPTRRMGAHLAAS